MRPLTLIAIIIAFLGCKKDECVDVQCDSKIVNTLTQDDKNWTPYTVAQLVFTSSLGDTIVLVANSITDTVKEIAVPCVQGCPVSQVHINSNFYLAFVNPDTLSDLVSIVYGVLNQFGKTFKANFTGPLIIGSSPYYPKSQHYLKIDIDQPDISSMIVKGNTYNDVFTTFETYGGGQIVENVHYAKQVGVIKFQHEGVWYELN